MHSRAGDSAPASAQPPEFTDVQPQSINKDVLYERDKAARRIVDTMLSSSGVRETVMIDYGFGIGKTSVVYKCRSLVSGWLNKPPNFALLDKAVYINVRCDEDVELARLDRNTTKDHKIYDKVAMNLLWSLLQKSTVVRLALSVEQDFQAFAVSLSACCGNQKFIVHFDDVGVFEGYNDAVATRMLYRIWHFGDTLKDFGHYFAMSGRSRLLHTVGQEKMCRDNPFSSPDTAVRISLPPLSDSAVESMVKSRFCD